MHSNEQKIGEQAYVFMSAIAKFERHIEELDEIICALRKGSKSGIEEKLEASEDRTGVR